MPEILRMPEVAANTPEAVLASWNVAVDAAYTAGTPIVTVETDKAVVDVEAEADGVLLRTLVDPGATVEVGAPIAVWGTAGEGPDDVERLLATLGLTGGGQPVPGPAVVPAPFEEADTGTSVAPDPLHVNGAAPARLFSSPLARRVAREHGVDLHAVVGTGPGGRIRRRDVEAALGAQGPVAPAQVAETSAERAAEQAPPTVLAATAPVAAAAGTGYREVPNSRVRQAIARRLTESKQTAPHFYVRGSARVDRLLALRTEVNAGGGPKVSVNDLVVKAVGRAHGLVPGLNVTWAGESVRHYDGVDVAVAVATDGGLVTPVVRGVERLTLHQVALATRDVAVRAKEKRLQQSELEGGTVTVSNLGMFGTEEFAAIINPPQAAILAVGAARAEPVVVDGALAVGTVLRVTLSVDHRPVDGATAAQWMQAFLGLLESPLQILV